MLLVKDLELREALLIGVNMLRIHEGLRYVILVVYQIGSFVVIFGEIHWEEYLVQIV